VAQGGRLSSKRGGREIEQLIDMVLLALMAATVIAIIRIRNLVAVVMLGGIYSLLAATLFVVLDAVDVAFTEAAVGAGISTILLLGTLALTAREEKSAVRPLFPLIIVIAAGAVLIYGTLDMPEFGSPDSPIHAHVAPRYLEKSAEEVGLPNVVTSVLASYRGYDTLGEVTVIFTAGIGVLALLGVGWRGRARWRRRS
jgi:multicomponent Na+:H+ antiporter subunit B